MKLREARRQAVPTIDIIAFVRRRPKYGSRRSPEPELTDDVVMFRLGMAGSAGGSK